MIKNDEQTNVLVGFCCDLYQTLPEYKEMSKLTNLIVTITPDTCKCGFSCMNYVGLGSIPIFSNFTVLFA